MAGEESTGVGTVAACALGAHPVQVGLGGVGEMLILVKGCTTGAGQVVLQCPCMCPRYHRTSVQPQCGPDSMHQCCLLRRACHYTPRHAHRSSRPCVHNSPACIQTKPRNLKL